LLVDGDGVMDAVTDEGVSDIVPLVIGAIDGRNVLDIDEAIAVLDPEEDVVLFPFDKVAFPVPSC
jgi:hypothetical protein